MQRIIQITIGGRVIPIEELAYAALDDYMQSLEMQFQGEAGKDEIIQDIENRISELFSIKLENGAQAIDTEDVRKVVNTLGYANELDEEPSLGNEKQKKYSHYQHNFNQQQEQTTRRLYRNPNDKMLGGVCSGIANYFGIDTVLVRLVFAILFITGGIGLLAYILAWIIIPVAKTPAEMYYMSGARPMDFETVKRSMGNELQDLKKNGEKMSQELKDFFSKKK